MIIERSILANTWRQGRLFLVAMLLALASALVPALCASGPPASRAVGSAFDPTTSAVALRGRAQALVHTETARDARTDGTPTSQAMLLPAFAPLLTGSAVLAIRAPRPRPAPALRQRRMTRAQPRAPPVAKA